MTSEQISKIKHKIAKIAEEKGCYTINVSEYDEKFELTFEGKTTFSLLDALSKELGTENINCGNRHIGAIGCRTCNGSYDEQVITIWDVTKLD